MFTNFKRVMVFVVLAFAALLLVACGEKEPAKPVLKAPTEITILVEDAPLEKATSVDGDDIVLGIEEQDGVDTSVTWESKNPKIATVDENGFVTPVAPGEVRIVATSIKNPEVTAEIKLRVHPADIGALLGEASNYVKSSIKYIDGTKKRTQLPCEFRTDLLSYKYSSLTTGTVDEDNNYRNAVWADGERNDDIEKLECLITYVPTGYSTKVMIEVYIVSDVENNAFTKIADAYAKVEALFANENIDLYQVAEKSLAIEKPDDVAVVWSSDVPDVLATVYVAGEGTSAREDDEFKLVYTRPLDYTDVELTAAIMTGIQGESFKITLKAVGYTKVEKVEYFKNEICGNLPSPEDHVFKDIKLPVADALFGFTVEWASDKPALLSNEGVYTDDVTKDSTQGEKVTLTATITYQSPNDKKGKVDEDTGEEYTEFTDPNSFVEEVKFEFMVYPCTETLRAANKALKYAKEHVAEGTGWFPWGKIDRASNQLVGLPATLGEADPDNQYASTPITWTCSEKGLFDNEWNLLKQYLRYHPVTMTGTMVFGDVTETIEFTLNVGIAQKEATSHIGGSFSRLAVQKSESILQTMDSLQTLSAFDEKVGSQQTWYKGDKKGEYYEIRMGASEDLTKNIIVQPTVEEDASYEKNPVTIGTQFGIGVNCGFAGLTMYWDDPKTGIRFQFYAAEAMTWVIGPENVDENGWLIDPNNTEYEYEDVKYYGQIYSMLDRYHQNWEHIVIVNMSGKDLKVPVSYSDDYDTITTPVRQTTFTPYMQKMYGCKEKFEGEGLGCISLSLYAGNASGIIINGKVGCIAEEAKWNDSLVDEGFNTALVNEETGKEEYCQYITLPNGGIAWTSGEGQDYGYTDSKGKSVYNDNKKYLETMLSTVGNDITVEFWNIHPCNTFTTNDEWQLPEGYEAQLSGVRKRTSTLTNVYFWARTLEASKVNPAWVAAAQAELGEAQ